MAVQISGNDITVPRDGTFSRNVSIAGTLTYEDVTNVDSIGLVTARNGIEVGASPGVAASISVDGNAIFSGITTIGGNVKVGTGVTISPDGDAFFTGVCTATSFVGDGSNLTGIGADLVNDTSPQLGGNLDTNSFEISLDDGHNINFGDGADCTMNHSGADFAIVNTTGNLNILNNSAEAVQIRHGSETMIKAISDGAVELYHDDTKQCETSANGLAFPDGKGIDFSNASGSAAGSASALLDDYEEGTYDGTLSVSSGTLVMNTSLNLISYTKIGRQVTITGRVNVSSVSGLSGYMTLNLPFTVANSTEADTAGAGSVFMYGAGGTGSPGYLGLWTMWTDGGNSFVYFTYGDGQSVTAGAKVSAGTGVRFTFTFFTS